MDSAEQFDWVDSSGLQRAVATSPSSQQYCSCQCQRSRLLKIHILSVDLLACDAQVYTLYARLARSYQGEITQSALDVQVSHVMLGSG